MLSESAEVSALRSWLVEQSPGERGPRRGRGCPLTCPFSEQRADPGLVAQAPHLEGSEEWVGDTQGQVGNSARAHPVQEAGRRESALHGWGLGLTTTVNGEEKKKGMNGERRRCQPWRHGRSWQTPLFESFGPQDPHTASNPCCHWWLPLPLSVLRLPLVSLRFIAPPIRPSCEPSAAFPYEDSGSLTCHSIFGPAHKLHIAPLKRRDLSLAEAALTSTKDCALIGQWNLTWFSSHFRKEWNRKRKL